MLIGKKNLVATLGGIPHVFYFSQWYATVLFIFAPNFRREGARQGCRAYERDR